MKLTLTVHFDPFGANPKDIQAALIAAGIDPSDIKVGMSRGPREPKKVRAPKAKRAAEEVEA
jgi:hypothetical protein